MKPETYTMGLTLYQMEFCPFCDRVRGVLRELNLTLPMKDTMEDPSALEELVSGGGKSQVPCLRIDPPLTGERTRWLYESADIARYLRERFG